MFKSIKENATAEVVEKKSKFIANVFYIESREEAEEIIKKINKQYHDARHNCYAYRIITSDGIIEKASDDGEPSGTAGAPMLTILSKNNLANVLVVVTRYFGGILLGTGGLVRAYSEAARNAVDNATIAEMGLIDKFSLHCDYQQYNRLLPFFAKYDVNINDTVFLEDVIINFALSNEKSESFLLALTDNFAGKISAQKEGQIFAPVNIIKNNID